MNIDVELVLDFEVTYTAEDGTSAEALVKDMLNGYESLEPACVVADCPYAAYVEFGTAPAAPTERKAKPTKFQLAIQQWVRTKLGITSEPEFSRTWRAVYYNIVRNGLLPTPYFRPAMHDTMDQVDRYWLDKGHTLKDIAEGIVVRAQRNLERNGSDYTGRLSESIRVDEDMVFANIAGRPDEGTVKDWIWDSDELGYDGVKRPDFRRWRR